MQGVSQYFLEVQDFNVAEMTLHEYIWAYLKVCAVVPQETSYVQNVT